MTAAIFAIVLGVAGASPGTAGSDGMAIAKRLTAAIKSGVEFQDGDFVQPLAASDKAALRRFATCKVAETGYTLKPDPTERDAYVRNPDTLLVRFDCKGVPDSTPVGITLHLRDGRIGTIQTHNADLMKDR